VAGLSYAQGGTVDTSAQFSYKVALDYQALKCKERLVFWVRLSSYTLRTEKLAMKGGSLVNVSR
jgi:hypothetical protein